MIQRAFTLNGFFHGLLLPDCVVPPPSIFVGNSASGEDAGLLLRYARVSLSTSCNSAGDRLQYCPLGTVESSSSDIYEARV